MKLPAMYDKLTGDQKRLVRLEYVKQQNNKCWYCQGNLDEQPPDTILKYKIDLKWFPQGFLDNPIHLQHVTIQDLRKVPYMDTAMLYCGSILRDKGLDKSPICDSITDMGDPFTKPYGGDMFDGDGSFSDIFFDDDDDFGDEELSFEDWEHVREIVGPSRTVWRTKEWKTIPVVEMTDAHIINTILMLERTNATTVATYPTLLVEARKRKLPLDKPIKRDKTTERNEEN